MPFCIESDDLPRRRTARPRRGFDHPAAHPSAGRTRTGDPPDASPVNSQPADRMALPAQDTDPVGVGGPSAPDATPRASGRSTAMASWLPGCQALIMAAALSLALPLQVLGQQSGTCGLMVMAHGGGQDWNSAVERAVAPVREARPTRIAFGMANPETLRRAQTELEHAGVACVAVVRLFMSAKSFLEQTEYLFGLRPDPPGFFMMHGTHGSSHEPPPPIPVGAQVVLSDEGLLDAPEIGAVLAERANAMHDAEVRQSVLVIAHGAGDDDVDAEWLRKLDVLADSVRATGRFHTVKVATLREDWKEKRSVAEAQIRSFVEEQSALGVAVIVVPFRLVGFGPYDKVLEGLPYVADGTGILPSPLVTKWIESQAQELSARAAIATGQ